MAKRKRSGSIRSRARARYAGDPKEIVKDVLKVTAGSIGGFIATGFIQSRFPQLQQSKTWQVTSALGIGVLGAMVLQRFGKQAAISFGAGAALTAALPMAQEATNKATGGVAGYLNGPGADDISGYTEAESALDGYTSMIPA